MRLLAVGDLHGNTDLLFRLLDSEKPDGVLGVGDWGDAGQITPETWDALLSRVPVATVFGNHDDIPYLASLKNHDGSPVLLPQGKAGSFGDMTLAGVSTVAPVKSIIAAASFCGLRLAAISGIWAKSHKKDYWVTDEDVTGWAKHLQTEIANGAPALDVLLTHGCPIGVADRTVSGRPGGQRCFLGLLQAVRPQVYLCGHLHVAQRRDLSDPPCAVINTGDLPRGSYVMVKKTADGVSADLRFAQDTTP